VSIGRGQSDANRIKEVEHEKQKKEEAILRGAVNDLGGAHEQLWWIDSLDKESVN
jgi:hypothetical protein